MAMRLSFTLDPETVELIDQYAKNRSIKREKAVLELLEAGFAYSEKAGEIKIEKKHSFEEYAAIRKDIEEIKARISDLTKEVKLVHHTLEDERNKETAIVPFQTKNWWEIWKM